VTNNVVPSRESTLLKTDNLRPDELWENLENKTEGSPRLIGFGSSASQGTLSQRY